MLIVPPSQVIKAQIEDATFWINPLTAMQRQEVMHFQKTEAGEVVADTSKMAVTALKYALKKAEGLLLPDGSEFKLEKDADGFVKEEHCQLLLDASTAVNNLALRLAQGMVIKTGPGVEVTYEGKTSTKKKSRKG